MWCASVTMTQYVLSQVTNCSPPLALVWPLGLHVRWPGREGAPSRPPSLEWVGTVVMGMTRVITCVLNMLGSETAISVLENCLRTATDHVAGQQDLASDSPTTGKRPSHFQVCHWNTS